VGKHEPKWIRAGEPIVSCARFPQRTSPGGATTNSEFLSVGYPFAGILATALNEGAEHKDTPAWYGLAENFTEPVPHFMSEPLPFFKTLTSQLLEQCHADSN